MDKIRKLLFENKWYFAVFFLLGIIGGSLLLCCTKEEITLWVNVHYNRSLDWFFLCVNEMGRVWFSGCVLFGVWIWKGWRTALRGFLCLFTVAIVIQFLKHIIFPGTLRPTLYFEGKETLRLLEGVIQLQTESFPSGHTGGAFAIVTFLALILPGKRYHGLLALLAASVGYARLYLSQHFITDIYAGMTIGVVVTTLVYLASRKI